MYGANPSADGESLAGEFDRRSAIKKAATAGAIVWAAPFVVSGPALAQGVTCTPKCAPSAFGTLDGVVEGYCPASGNKAARVDLKLATGAGLCPCLTNGVAVPADICVKVPLTWNKDGTGQEVDIEVGILHPKDGFQAAFYVAKTTGALGQGDWVTGTDPVLFGVTCQDREGGKISIVCGYTIGFYFDPAGKCGSPSGFFNTPRNDCRTICGVENPCA